jgi:hypothetical protein
VRAAPPACPIHPPAQPFKTKPFSGGTWYRVHRFDKGTGKYTPDAFNDTTNGDARFSPLVDPATANVIPTIYAAQTQRGAIAEIVLHDVPTPSTGHLHDWEQDKAGTLHLSEVVLARLNLVNLTTTGLRAAGLQVADFFGTEMPDYPRTREWALHIWQSVPNAQGLYWMSVRDNTCPVVMLFGDRVAGADLQDARNTHPIAAFETQVLQLLDELGCGLAIS